MRPVRSHSRLSLRSRTHTSKILMFRHVHPTKKTNSPRHCHLLTNVWNTRFRRLGLAAVTHVATAALPTELRLTGAAAVLADAVIRLVHERDTKIMEPLRPALVAVLPIVEPRPSAKVSKLHDRVFSKLLADME